MMRSEAGIAYPEGRMTQSEAKRLLAEGEAAIRQGCTVFDLAGAAQVDSVAVSLMLAWQRRAQQQGKRLVFRNLPDSVKSLIALYGVDHLIPA
jgi:phospholipid transport system transporter-binding protein